MTPQPIHPEASGDELDALLWKLQCDTIDEYKRHTAPVYKPLRDEAIEAMAAHQTAHTDAVVKKLKARSYPDPIKYTESHSLANLQGFNDGIKAAVALVKGGAV